ncbi:MAG: hypothetical protein ABSD68_02870 [Candidatus Micrarchaeales archaeon]|jgi:hypothetical protein
MGDKEIKSVQFKDPEKYLSKDMPSFAINAIAVKLLRIASESTEELINRSEIAGTVEGSKVFGKLTERSLEIDVLRTRLLEAFKNRQEKLTTFMPTKPAYPGQWVGSEEVVTEVRIKELKNADRMAIKAIEEMLAPTERNMRGHAVSVT